MASFQEGSAEERAWAATTEEAAEVRRQRISELEAVEQQESSLHATAQHQGGNGVGIFDSLKENTKSMLTAVKEATAGTAHDTADKARGIKDAAEEEARSLDATVAQGAGGDQRTAAERASEGFAGDENKYGTVGDEARGAIDYLVGKIDQDKATTEQQKSILDADAQHRPGGLHQKSGGGGGLFESLKESTKSLISAAKEATIGTAHDTADKTRGIKDTAVQEARSLDGTTGLNQNVGENQGKGLAGMGYRGPTAEKSDEEKYTLGDEARGPKDYVAEKEDQQRAMVGGAAQDTKNYLSEKKDDTIYTLRDIGREAKDNIVGTDEDKYTIRDAAHDAKDYAGEKMDEEEDKLRNAAENVKDYMKESDQDKYTIRDAARDAKDYAGEKMDEEENKLKNAERNVEDYMKESDQDKYTIGDAARDAKDYAGEKMDEGENKLRNAARNTEEHMKESDTDKYTVRDAARDAKDYTGEKLDEEENKLKNAARNAEEHMKESDTDKYTVRDAAGDAKDYTGEKVDEEANMMKNTAQDVKDYIAEKTEGLRKHLAGDAKERLGETPESAKTKLEIVEERKKEREETGWEDYERQRDEGERGLDATRNIYEAWPINVGSMAEAFKQNMTMPDEIVAQKRREEASPAAGAGVHQGRKVGDARATEEGVGPVGKLDPHEDRKP